MYKWRGWHQKDYVEGITHVRMNFWIRFDSVVPPVSQNFGCKIHGMIHNNWVHECQRGQWHWVSVVEEQTMEDVGHCLVIFDTVAQSVDVKIAMPSVQAF